ncbi:MAG TPA: TetR/AcrR family transcriptional regulator [Candidatus Hydrogenedentes bacterium]|nr:TetR/AcrR family transcriptional regulator [Candidatus Hydrogenedentota bacterium]HIJ74788.1 TetR/AcrR family transcriptional regulator [Candidatus Hydrogenedentota bacterium]
MSASTPKWRRRPKQRPKQVMDAALEVFSQKGFGAATMDEIAAEAGISKGTIYLYFPSKDELFLAMVRARLDEVLELLPQVPLDQALDLEGLAKHLGKELLDILMSPRFSKVFPLVMAEVNHLPGLKKLYQEEILPKVNIELADILEAGMALGFVKRAGPVIAARCLLGMFMVFSLTQEVFGAKEVTPMHSDEIVDTIVSIFFHGLMQRGTSE